MRRPTTREIGYALLFSIPPGIGATAFALNLIGFAPVIFAFGGGLTLALFLLVVVAVTTGENETRETGSGAP